METNVLLRVKNLRKDFPVRRGAKGLLPGKKEFIRAVDRINFTLKQGEILGFVGESGCGKSTMSRLILRLIEPTAGQVYIDGTEVNALSRHKLKAIRSKMQMIFQDPHGSLNPRRTVANTIKQSIRFHKLADSDQAENLLVRRTLEEVELRPIESFWDRYPDLLSGGQRQRVGIARVLVLHPKLVIADEPISMLDVSVRIGILDLLLRLRSEHGISLIYITHDLASARYICDRIAIMYLGQILEIAPTETILNEPKHPYTKALIAAVPVTDPTIKVRDIPIKGFVPTIPSSNTRMCKFYPRCLSTSELCSADEPELVLVKPDHYVACCNI